MLPIVKQLKEIDRLKAQIDMQLKPVRDIARQLYVTHSGAVRNALGDEFYEYSQNKMVKEKTVNYRTQNVTIEQKFYINLYHGDKETILEEQSHKLQLHYKGTDLYFSDNGKKYLVKKCQADSRPDVLLEYLFGTEKNDSITLQQFHDSGRHQKATSLAEILKDVRFTKKFQQIKNKIFTTRSSHLVEVAHGVEISGYELHQLKEHFSTLN